MQEIKNKEFKDYESILDKRTLWDFLKIEVKKHSIRFSQNIAKKKKVKLKGKN